MSGTVAVVDRIEAIDRIVELLDSDDGTMINTSMRLPVALREAAALAAEHLGLATSATTLTAAALRSTIEAAVMEAGLEEYYRENPKLQPSLAGVAVALAQLTGSPLAGRPSLIKRAAKDIVHRLPNATPHDVLVWVEAQEAARA